MTHGLCGIGSYIMHGIIVMAALLETCSDGIGTCSDVRLSVPMMWSRDGPNVNTILLGKFVTMHDIGS